MTPPIKPKRPAVEDSRSELLAALQASIEGESFVKLTLGKYRGDDDLKKCRVSLVSVRSQLNLRFVFQHQTKDITTNMTIESGLRMVDQLLGEKFLSGTLFTTTHDLTLSYTKRGNSRISQSRPTFTTKPTLQHNRKKDYLVDSSSKVLQLLGVTMANGRVKPSMSGKFKQICRFVEIIDSVLESCHLRDVPTVRVTDIGSGKGYLTFALHDHFTRRLGKKAIVVGIERRPELVAFCNQVCSTLQLSDVSFHATEASSAVARPSDILLALHACDTATDDAIFRGISTGATVILCAPCCQHELAPQLGPDLPRLAGITEFGLLKQRQADLVTDAARALLMEASGFAVKVIEFISTEHTNKNVMLVGVRSETTKREQSLTRYLALKRTFAFGTHRLETLLRADPGSIIAQGIERAST